MLALQKSALDEGYDRALQIDSQHLEAMLGAADARLAAGKLLAAMGDDETAQHLWERSTAMYLQSMPQMQAGEC